MMFREIVYTLLHMVKGSTQNTLERVFPQLQKESLHMSQQAFSKARQKIRWEAFLELFQGSVMGSYHEDYALWHGYRLMATDGSFLNLPSDSALVHYFGGLGHGCRSAAALVSLLYDLENDIVVDARISPVSGNERALAKEHLEALEKMESYKCGHKELILYDRGYPSYDFIKTVSDKEIGYVMRVQKDFIRAPERESMQDGWVTLGKSGMQVRMLQIPLKTGEMEILITNIGEAEVAYEAFGELYSKRWGIEAKYKELKQKLETENFSGRLVDNVKQDFYAMVTVANMVASCVREANRKAKKKRESQGNKYAYQVNVNHAIGLFKDRFIRIVIEEDRIARRYLMSELVRGMEQRVIPIRPDREGVRKECARRVKFHHNHKSNC
jgi:hypothetical protein